MNSFCMTYSPSILTDLKGKSMKKSDLKSGMVVETREGNRYLVIKDGDLLYFMNSNESTYLEDIYGDDLLSTQSDNFDIMKICDKTLTFKDVKYTTNLLWEREKPRKMTIEQLERIFGFPVEIVEEVQS